MAGVNLLQELQNALEKTINERRKLNETIRSTKTSIIERVKLLHERIDKAGESFLLYVTEIFQEEMARLENYEKQLNLWIAHLNEKYNSSIIEKEDSVKTEEKNDTIGNIGELLVYEHRHVVFHSGDDDESALQDILGKLDDYRIKLSHSAHSSASMMSASPELAADFQCQGSPENIHAIAPISENEAWLCSKWGSKEIHLYNTIGELKVSVRMDIRVDDMCVADNGDVLISSYNGNLIQRLDKDLKISNFVSLNFISRGIVIGNKNELYVCGVERHSSNKNENEETLRRHVISKFLLDGTHVFQINTHQHDPFRITLTLDNILCFSTYGSASDRQVVFMTMDGVTSATYHGETSITKPFYPLGLVNDNIGNILVTDWNNDCILLLNKSGKFKRFLVNKEHGIVSPSALAIDQKGRLWVGNATGSVMVFDYIL